MSITTETETLTNRKLLELVKTIDSLAQPSILKIAEAIGWYPTTVRRYLEFLPDGHPAKVKAKKFKGFGAGAPKLSQQQVEEILVRLRAGETASVLAREYGVTSQNISLIRIKVGIPKRAIIETSKVLQEVMSEAQKHGSFELLASALKIDAVQLRHKITPTS